jgi:C-terminal peptidase prc
MRSTTLAWILLPVSALALTCALHIARSAEAKPPNDVWDEQEFQILRRLVATTYVDGFTELQARDAFHAALDGYVKSLPDEYNEFIPPEKYRKWCDDTAGHYAGVGIRIDVVKGEGLKIAGLFRDGPAARAGLRIGDLITHVDGKPLGSTDLERPENLRVLKGAPGSRVRVMARVAPMPGTPSPAPGAPPLVREFDLERAEIRPPSVFSRRIGPDGSVGYIRLSEFVEATPADFDRALDGMLAAGVRSVVVDLRQNGGGVLPATVHCADRFLRSGDIVRMVGRTQSSTRSEVARDAGTVPESIGLVVLVDGQSASASEVFSGAIQDHKRGVLLGTRTYGKFTVQNITEIPGRNAAVKLTTARYLTPNGRSYVRERRRRPTDSEPAPAGLIPDVVVELSAEDLARLKDAFENQEEAYWGAPKANPDVAADWVDPQLQKALDLLAGKLPMQEIRDAAKKPKHG